MYRLSKKVTTGTTTILQYNTLPYVPTMLLMDFSRLIIFGLFLCWDPLDVGKIRRKKFVPDATSKYRRHGESELRR